VLPRQIKLVETNAGQPSGMNWVAWITELDMPGRVRVKSMVVYH